MRHPKPDPALLLLHALPFGPEMWWQQTAIVPNKTYSPNLYIFGKDIQSWAKQALAQVHESKIVIVGCSVGGSCALEIAALAPERIAALVLIGTKARHNPEPDFLKAAIDLLENNGVEAAWDTYWEPLLSLAPRKSKARSIALGQNIDHLVNGLTAFHTRPSREEDLANWAFPIHVITGEDDRLPSISYSRSMAERAKHGTLHIVKSAGHYLPITNADQVNNLIKSAVDGYTHQAPINP